MLNRELDQAIAYGERSRSLSRSIGNDEAGLNTAATLGSVLVFAGQHDSGWALLEDSVTRSVDRYLEGEAARGYRMIGTTASVVVEYDRAEHWLDRGIEYADRRRAVEPPQLHDRPPGPRALGPRRVGRRPSRRAEQALADGRAGITTRITALYVLGYLALGQARFAAATRLLSEALEAGSAMGELQRVSPALWGLAETAQLEGDFDRAIALCERGFAASDRVEDAAYLYPFLVTGTRAHLAQGDRRGAEAWVTRVERALRHRVHPRHPAGRSTTPTACCSSRPVTAGRPRPAWSGPGWPGQTRHRFWEGSWAALELARGTAPGEARSAPELVADGAGPGRRPSGPPRW